MSLILSVMVNGLHLYSAFTDPMATKALYILLHTHSYTDVGVSHARRHPSITISII